MTNKYVRINDNTIINKDKEGLEAYKKQKTLMGKIKKIDILEEELSEIKQLLRQIVNDRTNSTS